MINKAAIPLNPGTKLSRIWVEATPMGKDESPVTPAIRLLKAAKVQFTEHPFKYVEKGGTSTFAKEFGVDEHTVIKTLIMEDDQKRPLVILMHGDLEVSTKELARLMGVKKVQPCQPDMAQRHSGYTVGGTSPFGTRKAMPVFMEETILDSPSIYINGGKRGFLVGIDPKEVRRVLNPTLVRVGIKSH
jgi:Cys-tRNA(Pro) deacylase